MKKKLIAEVFHGMHMSKEAIIINVNGDLNSVFPIDSTKPDLLKDFHYKLQELQYYGYELKFK